MREYFYLLANDRLDGIVAIIAKLFLSIFSCLYWVVVSAWEILYRIRILPRYALSRPVVSVGNLTWGGVGKTPLVECIAALVQEKQKKAVILTRGYMPGGKGVTGKNISDEAAQLQESLPGVPVVVGSNRLRNGRRAVEQHDPDIVILDDGFQHQRIKRDLDIVAIDAINPFGNGYLVPRGILREPPSALVRADVFVLTKIDQGKDNLMRIRQKLQAINPEAMIVETVHESVDLSDLIREDVRRPLSALSGKRAVALCSIGNPLSLEASLGEAGIHLHKLFAFMDHHIYSSEDIKKIVAYCQKESISEIITTHKDAVKLRGLVSVIPENLSVSFLKIRIKIIKGQDEFFNRILNLLGR